MNHGADWPALPEPTLPVIGKAPFGILVTGVGGTGVVTISAILGMAAHLAGKGVGVIDMAGLAQKGGAVYCHVKIGNAPEDVHAIRIAAGEADLVLGCDLIVSGTKKVLAAINKDDPGVFVNTAEVYPGDFTRNADFTLASQRIKRAIVATAGQYTGFVDATSTATALLGNSIGANMFMLGFAYQRGFVPLSEEVLLKAIELNGEAVKMNQAAFQWGRRTAADPKRVDDVVRPLRKPTADRILSSSREEMVERRVAFLTDYQSRRYARRYHALADKVLAAEAAKTPGKHGLAEAVSRYYFKLLAIKDEYEVARLYTDGAFARQVAAVFEGNLRYEFHLAPPIMGRKDPQGRPIKATFGPWMMSAFGVLAKLRFLRGTPLDIFGHSEERQRERKLIADYEGLVDELLQGLTSENHSLAVALASIPEKIRGYGHVKETHLKKAKAEDAELLTQFRGSPKPVRIAAE